MGTIKLTTINNFIHLHIGAFDTDKCMINWGDGSEDEYVPVREEYKDEDGEIEVYYEINAQHTYTDGKSSHTVTIRGKIKGCNMSGCEVTSIDATKCPALEGLYCSDNQLTSLDVSGCTALKTLWCYKNNLTSLDVSGCTKLRLLECPYNQLTSLDVSKNTALERLWCYNNQFSASAMNKIYNDLPIVWDGEIFCDRLGDYSIAERKGYKILFN